MARFRVLGRVGARVRVLDSGMVGSRANVGDLIFSTGRALN